MMPGMIMLWHGTVDNIPSGWHDCDGTMGTPNLRNRFVVGTGVIFPQGESGGTLQHNHNFTGDGHYHGIPQAPGCPGAGPNPCLDGLNTDSEPAVGTTDNGSNTPPYRSLHYIMKL